MTHNPENRTRIDEVFDELVRDAASRQPSDEQWNAAYGKLRRKLAERRIESGGRRLPWLRVLAYGCSAAAVLAIVSVSVLMMSEHTDDGVRRRIALVQADQRSIAAAIEGYEVDASAYPAAQNVPTLVQRFDPTNGTTSFGDIYEHGEKVVAGNYSVPDRVSTNGDIYKIKTDAPSATKMKSNVSGNKSNAETSMIVGMGLDAAKGSGMVGAQGAADSIQAGDEKLFIGKIDGGPAATMAEPAAPPAPKPGSEQSEDLEANDNYALAPRAAIRAEMKRETQDMPEQTRQLAMPEGRKRLLGQSRVANRAPRSTATLERNAGRLLAQSAPLSRTNYDPALAGDLKSTATTPIQILIVLSDREPATMKAIHNLGFVPNQKSSARLADLPELQKPGARAVFAGSIPRNKLAELIKSPQVKHVMPYDNRPVSRPRIAK